MKVKQLILVLFSFGTIFSFSQEKDSVQSKIDSLENNLLSEVSVKTHKKLFERKVDRLVFNVENSIQASGGDVLDALKITPGIRVENDKISMIGKSGMSVMIDERIIKLSGEDLVNYLRSIPSDNIKSIEVISTPPAKYEAEGNSGIINIQLKKAKKDSWNASLRSAYIQRKYDSEIIGGDFNFQKNKISLTSSITYNNFHKLNVFKNTIFYDDGNQMSNSSALLERENINLNLGIDYNIKENWILGFQYLGNYSDLKIKSNPLISKYNLNNNIDYYIKSIGNNNETPNMSSINLHSIHKLDSLGKKINIDFDYFNYLTNTNGSFSGNNFSSNLEEIPNTFFANQSKNNKKIDNYSTKIDFNFPLKWAKLNFGTKLSFSKTDNDFKFFNYENNEFNLDKNRSNIFKYKENIQALYASMNKKINDKIEIQLGLRSEFTQTEGFSLNLNQSDKNDYVKFFPTFYINYTASENNLFSLSYNKRINRPNYEQLNPFIVFLNPSTIIEGNPFLKPSYTDNLELVYTYKKLESKLYYSYLKDGFRQVPIIDEINQSTKYFPMNFYNQNTIGISESITFKPLKFWETTNNIDISYSQANSYSKITTSSNRGFIPYFSTDNNFMLNSKKTLLFSIGFWISFSGIDDLDYYITHQNFSSGLKYFLFDKKLQISLTANDIFGTERPIFQSYSNGIKQEFNNYFDQQQFRFSLNYKFGSSKINIQKREGSNQEEKQRAN